MGLAWTSWNQWPHPQRCADPFFRSIHIMKVLSSSPAHTHTHQKMDRCHTMLYLASFPDLPHSNLCILINLLLYTASLVTDEPVLLSVTISYLSPALPNIHCGRKGFRYLFRSCLAKGWTVKRQIVFVGQDEAHMNSLYQSIV